MLLEKKRIRTFVSYSGFGLLLAWITCSFRTNFLFHSAEGIGINSNAIWLFSIGSCCMGLLAYPFYRRWFHVWTNRGGLKIVGLLSAGATALFPFSSSQASSEIVPLLIGMGSGLLYAFLIVGWTGALAALDREAIEIVLPSNMVITPVCLIVLSLLPESVIVVLVSCLPLSSAFFLANLLRDSASCSLATPCDTFTSARAFVSRIARSALCFATAFFVSAMVETVVPGSVLVSASWGARLAFQTPTVTSGLFAVLICFIVIEFSIRIDLPCIYRWAAPLLLAGLAFNAAGNEGLWSLVFVKVAYDAFFLLGLVMILGKKGDPEHRQLTAVGFIALSEVAFIAGSGIATIGLQVGWFSPEASALLSLLLFCLTFYFVPSTSVGKRESAIQSIQEFEERRSLEEAVSIIARRYQLTNREREVASYIVRGRSRPYIQEAMHLSKNTVATHAKNLYTKTNVHSKQELIDLIERSQVSDS